MKRRDFIRSTAGATTMLVSGSVLASSAASAQGMQSSGSDLTGWRTVLGDGIFVGPGQNAVSLADIETLHEGTHSTLRSNVQERGVMAHNITFDRFTASDGMTKTHFAEVDFRIPTVPDVTNWDYNAQTVEIGVFVWDGAVTRSDYGIAIQWVLNPWVNDFGAIRAWTMSNGVPDWVAVGYLAPDAAWHTFHCNYRPGETATIEVDGVMIDVEETVTEKSPSWGSTVDGRFQLETVSVWPGANPSVPTHSAEFRDWSWAVTS